MEPGYGRRSVRATRSVEYFPDKSPGFRTLRTMDGLRAAQASL